MRLVSLLLCCPIGVNRTHLLLAAYYPYDPSTHVVVYTHSRADCNDDTDEWYPWRRIDQSSKAIVVVIDIADHGRSTCFAVTL